MGYNPGVSGTRIGLNQDQLTEEIDQEEELGL